MSEDQLLEYQTRQARFTKKSEPCNDEADEGRGKAKSNKKKCNIYFVGELGKFCVPEYKFHPIRKWRIDLAFPNVKLAVELEGGCWVGGRHTTGAGFVKDMEKYNALTEMGWHLLRYQPSKICYEQIEKVYDNLRKMTGNNVNMV